MSIRFTTSFLLFILIAANIFAQRRHAEPASSFTVLHAYNARTASGKLITSLDAIAPNDLLIIEDEGVVVLIHSSGFPLEFNRDTTVNIQDMENLFNTVPVRNKKAISNNRIASRLEHLFITKPSDANWHKLQTTGLCADCHDDLELIYPPRFNEEINRFGSDLCLRWRDNGTGAYVVTLEDSNGGLLKQYRVAANELVIDKQVLAESHEILLSIADTVARQASVRVPVKRASAGTLPDPFPCTIVTAPGALLTGLYYELRPNNYLGEAEKYFALAARLSHDAFYRQMLDNFRTRNGKY